MTASDRVDRIGVGIDTARYGHRVHFLRADRQPAAKGLTVTENRQGYDLLQQELQRLGRLYPQAQFHVHLDAAGQYAANLERFLRSLDLPLKISVGEPKRNKDYAKAIFPKQTNDDTDSRAMARFAVVERPKESCPVPDEFRLLREVASRLHGQVKDTVRSTTRLHELLARVFPELACLAPDLDAGWVLSLLDKYPTPQRIAAARLDSLKKVPYLRSKRAEAIHRAASASVGSLSGELAERLVRQMAAEVRQCQRNQKALEGMLADAYRLLPQSGHVRLETIPGIGQATAAVLAAKMVSIQRFATPEALVGYFGVFPEECSSGVDKYGKPLPPGTRKMSKKGCDLVRGYLWNAAKNAIVNNPAVRQLYQRLRARGLRGDVALGHCMRKLLHQAFAVWKSDQPFDPRRGVEQTAPATEAASAATPSAPAASEAAPPSTETAAGHNREVIPDRTVVTAAASHLEPVIVTPPAAGDSIHYPFLRAQIGMERVLSHLGLLTAMPGGAQRRGPCPLCNCGKPRSLSVNLKKDVYRCFQPGCSAGNVLDFWAAHQRLPLHAAALKLIETFNLRPQP